MRFGCFVKLASKTYCSWHFFQKLLRCITGGQGSREMTAFGFDLHYNAMFVYRKTKWYFEVTTYKLATRSSILGLLVFFHTECHFHISIYFHVVYFDLFLVSCLPIILELV